MFPRIHPVGTSPDYFSAGWKGKSEAAAAKIAAAKDPVRLAVATFRSRSRDLGEARKIAEQEFAANHAPVDCPLPAQMHRDVVDILVSFLAASGLDKADLLAPLKDHETIEAIEARHVARLQADLDVAKAEFLRVERQEALDRLAEAQKALADVEASHARPVVEPVDESPVEAPVPAPSLDRIEQALAAQVAAVPGADPVKRPRGRPPGPRVSLDPNAGNEALPVAEPLPVA